MWYEALPSLAIIGVCMTMPQILVYITHQLAWGNPYRRMVIGDHDTYHLLRDTRLSGTNNPYKQIGLDEFVVEEDKK